MSTEVHYERVISGDSHVREPVTLWQKTLSHQLGDRTPRPLPEYKGLKGHFFFSGRLVSKYGVQERPPEERTPEEDLIVRAGYDPGARVDFQKQAGVAAEILYPSITAQMMAVDDIEVAQASCAVYNDWIMEFASHDRKRLIPVPAVPVHDIDWAVKEFRRCLVKGARGILVNVAPPLGALPYTDHAYDKLWAACEEANAPVVLHIITGQKVDPIVYFHEAEQYRDAPRHMIALWNEIQESLANDFIFGGILDRFPKLKVLCGEYEISWIPHFMFRIDQMQSDFTGYMELQKLKHRASDYMRTRVYHGIIDDPFASNALPQVGYSQVLWGSDFPHVRSIGVDTQSRLSEMLSVLPKKHQHELVAENTARLFGL